MYILHVFVLYLFSKTNLNNCVPSSKWNVYNPYENNVTGWIMKEYFSIFTFQSQKRLYIHQCLLLHVSVCNQNPSTAWNQHPSLFFIHPSFILQLLSFSAFFSLQLNLIFPDYISITSNVTQKVSKIGFNISICQKKILLFKY